MNPQQNQDESDVWFRPRNEGESQEVYTAAWLTHVDMKRLARMEIGQPGPGQRIGWEQRGTKGCELTAGMMISDGRPNQTWRRIYKTIVVSTEKQTELREQGLCVDAGSIMVQLKEHCTVLYFHPDGLIWALVPEIVEDGPHR